MNIYCTEASMKFFFIQLKKSGLTDEEAQRIIGHTFILDEPPLTKKIMVNNIEKIFRTLSELKYQEKAELIELSTIIEKNDIHSALYLNNENCIELFKTYEHITKLNMETSKVEIRNDGQVTYFHFNSPSKDLNFYSVQGCFYLLAQRMKKILGEQYDATKIQVAVMQNKVPDEERLCNSVTENIITGYESNYISMPTEMALAKNKHYNHLIQPYIEEQLAKEYAIRLSADPFFDTILNKIADTIEHKTDELSINTIANAMNMSRSTLYRSLSERNLTFSQIIEEKRRTMSMDLLINTSISIGEISDRLGYKNLSAFNRAFKRWFDNTPLAMRKSQ